MKKNTTKKKTNNTPEKMYAFWRYDAFPYFCGGTVTKLREDGRVDTEECGPGFTFRPVLIVPVKQGKAIREELRELEKDYNEAENRLHKEFLRRLDVVLPLLAQTLIQK